MADGECGEAACPESGGVCAVDACVDYAWRVGIREPVGVFWHRREPWCACCAMCGVGAAVVLVAHT